MEHNDTFVRLNDVSFMFKEQSVLKNVNLSLKREPPMLLLENRESEKVLY